MGEGGKIAVLQIITTLRKSIWKYKLKNKKIKESSGFKALYEIPTNYNILL